MTQRLALPLLLTLVACGHGHDHDHDHGDHDHSHGEHSDGEGGHSHDPVYGGTLIVLGDEVAHVELVLDAEAGSLTLYSMDAHAEQAERLAMPSIEVTVELADGPRALQLEAQASALSGETVGDTSEFRADDPALVGLADLAGTITRLETRGVTFEGVPFPASGD